MAKELFISKPFNAEHKAIIAACNTICISYQSQGYDLSLRQLYYQLVSRQPLESEWANTEANYKKLGNIISDARLAGMIDWSMITDRGRTTEYPSHWTSPASILDSAAAGFRIDLWADQANHVEVMVEKQALEGVLEPVCNELDIRFTANKGYSSSSAMYVIGKRIRSMCRQGKDAHVLYLGDHDPSGIDMTRDVQERLELFSGYSISVNRLALNMDQVEEYNPPENPAKLSDSRSGKYVEEFGESSWELDALEPSVLAALVRDAVEELRDQDSFDEAETKQQTWKDELSALADNYRLDNEG